jgi:hypothetical protein
MITLPRPTREVVPRPTHEVVHRQHAAHDVERNAEAGLGLFRALAARAATSVELATPAGLAERYSVRECLWAYGAQITCNSTLPPSGSLCRATPPNILAALKSPLRPPATSRQSEGQQH